MTTTMPETTTAPAPTSKRVRYPLDALRGLAAVGVLIFHSYQHNYTDQWPGGEFLYQVMTATDFLVDLFFVLSAFVLWLPVAGNALNARPGQPGWMTLYKRAARLLPLYLSVVLVVWAVTNPALPGHWEDLLSHLTFTHVYSDTYIFWTVGPAWSLAVEFHFYLLMALAVPVVHRLSVRATTRAGRVAVAMALPVALIVAGVAYLAWQILVAQPPTDQWSAWFTPIAKAPAFGIGMSLAVLCAAGVRIGPVARKAAALGGLVLLAWLAAMRPVDTIAGNWWSILYASAIAVALSAIVLHDGPYPRILSWRPLVRLGFLGYGVYLIHEPILRLLDHVGVLPDPAGGPTFLVSAVLVAIPSIALAWVSSKTVEAAGLKLLATVDSRGKARDYYAHVK